MANLSKKERTRAFAYAAKLRNNAQTQGRSDWTADEIEIEAVSQAASVYLADLNARKIARITEKLATLDEATQATEMAKLGIDWED